MRAFLTAAVLLTLSTMARAQNCCLPRLADDDASDRLFSGIQAATVLLMTLPLVLVVGMSCWVYRSQQAEPGHAEREAAVAERASSSDADHS